MIDIQKNFDTTTISDVAFAALETFAESGCDLIYLQDIQFARYSYRVTEA